jgi:acyl carrier protein
MAERGAGHIILMGRSAFPDAAAENALPTDDPRRAALAAIRTMRELGAKVDYVALDIADTQQVAVFLRRHATEGAAPIRGFIHAAGIYRDEALVRLDRGLLRDVLRAKVMGAWIMHQLLPSDSLDFFVLYSSFSALTPPHGQAAYAAANALLDVLAHQRVRLGLPGLSINWGAWSEVGFAASAVGREAQARLEGLGVRRMTPKQALAMLERIMAGAAVPPQIGVFPMDVWKMAQADPVLEQMPLLAELGANAEQAADEPSADRFQHALRLQDIAAQRDFLLDGLRRIVADIMQTAPAKLNPDTSLTQLGLDSLIAVHLKNRVQKETGFDLPLVSALNGGSLASMTDELMMEWRMQVLRSADELAQAASELVEEFEL